MLKSVVESIQNEGGCNAGVKLGKELIKIGKKQGYNPIVVNDGGMEISVDTESIDFSDGAYAYGMDQNDNDVELDLCSGDYTIG